jgi:putative MATE family efflux protein
MKDLTQGPILRHVVEMAAPIAIGMLVQTLYFLVDLYFVARLGDYALAGVGSAGNATFITLALTQMLGVATVALIAHAVGRKDKGEANLIFNQSLLLSVLCAALTLAGGYALTRVYMGAVGADAATASAGATYLYWYLPGLALQFALIAMGSGLRGTGIVQPTIIVQMLSVVVNIILAPVLIAGWGTGHALGVAGAGLASSISVAAGVALMSLYFLRLERYVGFHADLWRPRFAIWMRMLNLGLPAGGEFALMFVFIAVIYWIIRDFGAAAQAGFGVAMRLMQAIFLPAMAIAFATAPIAGQNFGAGSASRVRETFRSALLIGSAIMVALTLFCQWRPDLLMRPFTTDPQVIAVGAQYLRIVSWNFVATGIIFTCSGIFQALGNTWPSLLSTGSRVVTFVVPAIWLSRQPNFRLEHLWYLSVGTVTLQAVTSLWLLATQFRRRLQPGNAPHATLASM